MEEIVAGLDDGEKEQYDEETTEKKTENNIEAAIENYKTMRLDTGVEKECKTENEEKDDGTEENFIGSTFDHNINNSRGHHYVKDENLYRVR